MFGMIGKKLGMTRLFDEDGRSLPVTVLQVGPCVVTQVKTVESDGYNAVQLGYGQRKPKNTPMPMQGHFRKAGAEPMRMLREFRLEDAPEVALGETVDVGQLAECERVDVTGTTKGRGFAGRIKRHNHHRGPDGHGSKNVRQSGGIGQHTYPGRVIKGKPMAGHYGNKRETKKNLTVVEIDRERNLVLVKGSVPGHNNGFVFIRPSR